MTEFRQWTARDAAGMLSAPRESDDKYSRGVLGVMTGSTQFPGAAVIGVDAALHTGVGMLRYVGPQSPTNLVLARRPEAVTVPGKVQAWLLGSGMPAESKPDDVAAQLESAATAGLPTVLDAGALDLVGSATGPTVITPHRGELARLLGVDVETIDADPSGSAERAAEQYNSTVLLKGHQTLIVGAGGSLKVTSPTTWLATAGTGDSLAGILGALLATHSRQLAQNPADLPRLAATASVIHGLAAEHVSGGGPFTVLDLNAAIPFVIAGLLRRYPET